MSNFLNIRGQDALTIGVTTIIGASVAYNSLKLFKRFINERQPKKWRKVGQISELWCFPIKSCGPAVRIKEFECSNIGPKAEYIGDRLFMVTHENGNFITSRTYTKMVLISPKFEGKFMTLSAPGMSDIKVDVSEFYKIEKTISVKVWGDDVDCVDCGDKIGQWFSKFILEKENGLRLLFYPSSEPKPYVNDKKYLFEQADRSDTGTLHDETSFMLMNQGSFDDLNTRIEKPVKPLQYRPNFVVKGAKAWEENDWKWVKIGNETIFKNVQPCTRCVSTIVDPSTGERNPQMEPLKTLKTFRTFPEVASSPVFGIHLGLRSKGIVKVGDDVYVSE